MTTTGFARTAVEPFIVAYWACQESQDTSKANCKVTMVESLVKIGATTHKIGIPTITNSKPLDEGDEIVVLKQSPAGESEQQPDAKKPKVAQSTKGKKRKGTGNGRASK